MGISFKIESAVTVFPQPDSPTRQTVSPESTRRETSSIARTIPSSRAKWVVKPWTSNKAWLISVAQDRLENPARIEHVSQAIADKVDGKYGNENCSSCEQRPMRGGIEIVFTLI